MEIWGYDEKKKQTVKGGDLVDGVLTCNVTDKIKAFYTPDGSFGKGVDVIEKVEGRCQKIIFKYKGEKFEMPFEAIKTCFAKNLGQSGMQYLVPIAKLKAYKSGDKNAFIKVADKGWKTIKVKKAREEDSQDLFGS